MAVAPPQMVMGRYVCEACAVGEVVIPPQSPEQSVPFASLCR